MKLINADELKNYIKIWDVACGCNDDHQAEILRAIDELDPAQPEIIMCKDCTHRPIKKDGDIVPPKEDDWKCPCLCEDYYYSWIPRDDFFCANGERGEEE